MGGVQAGHLMDPAPSQKLGPMKVKPGVLSRTQLVSGPPGRIRKDDPPILDSSTKTRRWIYFLDSSRGLGCETSGSI